MTHAFRVSFERGRPGAPGLSKSEARSLLAAKVELALHRHGGAVLPEHSQAPAAEGDDGEAWGAVRAIFRAGGAQAWEGLRRSVLAQFDFPGAVVEHHTCSHGESLGGPCGPWEVL